MTNPNDEELDQLLARSDPSIGDPPPETGSTRHNSILERAMTTTDAEPITPIRPSQPTRRRVWLAGAAAAIVAAATGVVALQLGSAPSAQAVIADAAAELREVTSLEGELTSTSSGNTSTARIAVDGDRFSIEGETLYADGHTEGSTMVVVDDFVYETIDGEVSRRPADPDELPAPFAASSAAVIDALLTGSDVTEQEAEQLDGVTATRYDIVLTDSSVEALAALEPAQLGWFELEYPDLVRELSVWIDDGLIRQVEVTSAVNTSSNQGELKTTRARFTNLDDDVTVTPPPGPYSRSEDTPATEPPD